jgi:hypothetical protein
MDGSQWNDGLSYLGSPEENVEKAVLLALGLRCRREGCAKCEKENERHDTDKELKMFTEGLGETAEGGAGLGKKRKLTYDMLPGSFMTEGMISNASVEPLKRWLKCRGMNCAGTSKEELKRLCLNKLKLESEDPGSVELICPDARSLIEYLIQSRRIKESEIPPQWNQKLRMDVTTSPHWITNYE